jgi:hypothetical protein
MSLSAGGNLVSNRYFLMYNITNMLWWPVFVERTKHCILDLRWVGIWPYKTFGKKFQHFSQKLHKEHLYFVAHPLIS